MITPRPPKSSPGRIIKLIFCIIIFIAVSAFFAIVCRDLANDYLILADFTAGAALSWLINFGVSALLMLIMLGVTAVLARPFWLAVLVYFTAAAVYAAVMGMGNIPLIAGAAFFVGLFCYLISVVRQFNNQLRFSLRPFAEKKLLISFLLAALVSVSFALGYMKDSARDIYVLPPQARTLLIKQVESQFESFINKQAPQITAEQKQEALRQTLGKTQGILNDMEKSAQPYKEFIPIAAGAIAFLVFQTALFLISLIAPLLLALLFLIFKLTHYIRTAVEKTEIKRITL